MMERKKMEKKEKKGKKGKKGKDQQARGTQTCSGASMGSVTLPRLEHWAWSLTLRIVNRAQPNQRELI